MLKLIFNSLWIEKRSSINKLIGQILETKKLLLEENKRAT